MQDRNKKNEKVKVKMMNAEKEERWDAGKYMKGEMGGGEREREEETVRR